MYLEVFINKSLREIIISPSSDEEGLGEVDNINNVTSFKLHVSYSYVETAHPGLESGGFFGGWG